MEKKLPLSSDSSPPRRKNQDSSPPRRKNQDSSPPRRKNQDSSPPRRKNQDSSPPRRKVQNTDQSFPKDEVVNHNSGLQTGSQFGANQRKILENGKLELSTLDSSISGKDSETVYRDKKGRKLDMATEFMRTQALKEGKKLKIESAQFQWGIGSVQKKQALTKEQELEEIAAEPFARTEDDPKLESMRKEAIRDGDPMAEYIRSRLEKKRNKKEEDEERRSKGKDKNIGDPSGNNNENNNNNLKAKPVYQGPAPPSNRFNIRPGYRWDGIDRGSEFEEKISKRKNYSSSLKDDNYRWSVSDM